MLNILKLFGGAVVNPRTLMILGLLATLFVGMVVVYKLEKTTGMLAQAEIERQLLKKELEAKDLTQKRIAALLSEVKQIQGALDKQRITQQDEYERFSKKLDELDFESFAKANPQKAMMFIQTEYANRLSCIEKASGNTLAKCDGVE